MYDRETGSQQLRGLVMREIHRRRLRRYKFQFSFVGNDRRPSQKSGTCRENRNALDSPDLSPSILNDQGYIRFRVFSGQNLGQSGNSKTPDRLGFFRHMKTRLKSDMPSLTVFCRLFPIWKFLEVTFPGWVGEGFLYNGLYGEAQLK